MADGTAIKDATGTSVTAATDQLSDGQFSPKVSLLDGSGSPNPIDPRIPYTDPASFVSGAITTAMTATTSTLLIAAPAAGLRNYITQITVSNSHATVGTDVIIQDGSAGTTLYVIPAAAAYGGAVLTFPAPLRQPTTATGIYCANVTTGSSTKVSASGYKGA